MQNGLFKPLIGEELDKLALQKNVGFAPLRIVPKDNGARPIVNANKSMSLGQKQKRLFSGNELLKDTFAVLNYEKSRQNDSFGCTVMGFSDIYCKIKQFVLKLRHQIKDQSKRLYMAKLDLKNAFNEVDQEDLATWLLKIVKEVSSLHIY